MANRRYQLKRRAEQQEETRSRIVEAAVELHQTIGPAATTFSDIAERARVGRVTVYRHFPDELALAGAGAVRVEGDRRSERAAANRAGRGLRLPPRHRGDDDPRARRRPRPSD